jgi:hypothetical protein
MSRPWLLGYHYTLSIWRLGSSLLLLLLSRPPAYYAFYLNLPG